MVRLRVAVGLLLSSFAALGALACGDDAPPSTEGVGREVIEPPPRAVEDESARLYDAEGVPLASDVVVAGLVLPRGLTKIDALSSTRRHVYRSEIPAARLLRYFGPRLTTMQIDRAGERVTYVEAIPRGVRGGIVKLDVTIQPSSAEEARVEILERAPPMPEGAVVSEEEIRRHLDRATKNRE